MSVRDTINAYRTSNPGRVVDVANGNAVFMYKADLESVCWESKRDGACDMKQAIIGQIKLLPLEDIFLSKLLAQVQDVILETY